MLAYISNDSPGPMVDPSVALYQYAQPSEDSVSVGRPPRYVSFSASYVSFTFISEMLMFPVLVMFTTYSTKSPTLYWELLAVLTTKKLTGPWLSPLPVTSGPTPEKWGILIHSTLLTVSL